MLCLGGSLSEGKACENGQYLRGNARCVFGKGVNQQRCQKQLQKTLAILYLQQLLSSMFSSYSPMQIGKTNWLI